MKDKDLNAFLASVRRTRFVDYLDPLGETAQNAFERRLSWARVSQHDPAYADEARFLLDNADGLRELLRQELEEDDWIEEADVGREWEARVPNRQNKMRENDRITEIFQPDDLDVNTGAQKVQKPRGAQKTSRRTDEAAPSRSAEPRDEGRRSVLTPRPNQRVEPPEPPKNPKSAEPTRPVSRKEPANRSSVRSDAGARERSNRPLGSTPNPAQPSSRNRTPASQSRSPVAERSRMPADSKSGRSLDGNFQKLAATQQGDDEQTMRLGPNGAPEEAEFDDWDAPDDPVSSTGIMRIEDITAPPVQRDTSIPGMGFDSSETVARPLLRNTPQPILVNDEVSTAPSAATRLRRPGESSVGALPRVRASVQEPPPRSRLPLLAMFGLSILALGGLFVAGIAAAPMVYQQTNGFQDLTFGGVLSKAPAPEPPQPEPAAPEPAAPAPTEPGAPAEPQPAAPGPANPSPAPEAPAPAPAPAPEPAKAAKAEPKPVPAPEPPIAPTEAPESTARPVNVEGLWIGSTSTVGSPRSFKLIVLGQTDEAFEGTVDLQLEDGTFASFAISGKVDGAGDMSFNGSFNGSETKFTGKVKGARVGGTYSIGGKRPENWSATGSNGQ